MVIPSTDMVVATGLTPGLRLYYQVVCTAAEVLSVGIDDIFSIFEKRQYSASIRPICDLGFFNCCTVEVIVRDGWVVAVQAGDVHFEVEVDAMIFCNELNSNILALASARLDV